MTRSRGAGIVAGLALAAVLCSGSVRAASADGMLTIAPPADITTSANMPCGQSYCAQVFYSFTASGGTPPYNFVCNLDSGSLFLVGVHTISCLAQDSRGNSTPNATFTLTVTPYVQDVTPPVFQNVPGPITVTADSSGRAIVYFTAPTAIDAHDGPVPVHCQPSSGGGDPFPIGVSTVTCTAEDASANTATATITITVVAAGTAAPPPPPTTAPAPPPTTPTTTTAPPPGTTTVTTVVTTTATTTVASANNDLQAEIDALKAQISALASRVLRLEKAPDMAALAFEQAINAGASPADAADLARGTFLNAEYGLGAFSS